MPVAGFVLWLWVQGLDIGARITFLYTLLLLAVSLFDWKGQIRAPFNRAAIGWAGGVMMIASIFLPWRGVSLDLESSLLDPGSISWFVPQLIAIGGILSIASRFGGLVTMAGVWDFLSIPIFCPANGCPTVLLGPGFGLALAGIGVSLLGKPLNLPLQLRLHGRTNPRL